MTRFADGSLPRAARGHLSFVERAQGGVHRLPLVEHEAIPAEVRPAGLLLLGRQLLLIPLFSLLPLALGFSGLYFAPALADLPFAIIGAILMRREWRALSGKGETLGGDVVSERGAGAEDAAAGDIATEDTAQA